MSWYKVETTMGELIEYTCKPSMRKIKADLNITGKRLLLELQAGQYTQYRMQGTTYKITITDCN
jgi:hypothetical protein